MGVRKKTIWNEYKIQQILCLYFLSKNSKKYELLNLFVYDWESDYLAITHSDISYECEIKITRQDFLNDSKKRNKHLILEGKDNNIIGPNYFYYAVPENLINIDEIPSYAGLIYVFPFGIQIMKAAPKLHNKKFDYQQAKLMDKLYYNLNNYRTLYKESDIPELKKTISKQQKELMWYDDEISRLNCEIDELKMHLKKNNIQC